tara:strand:- start:1885 stop:2832 length:948 start_codon:yes stop_codon:yes gene_type:complete
MPTYLSKDNFFSVNTLSELKAVPSSGLSNNYFAIVMKVSGENAPVPASYVHNGPTLYAYKASLNTTPIGPQSPKAEPWTVKPDDVLSTDPGRWVTAQTLMSGESATLAGDFFLATTDGRMQLYASEPDIPTTTKLDFWGWYEASNDTKSGTGIAAGTDATSAEALSLHLFANTVRVFDSFSTHNDSVVLLKALDDLQFTADHGSNLPISTRRPPIVQHSSGTETFSSTSEENVIKCTASGVTVNFPAGQAGQWCQVLNASSGDATLSFTGTTYNVYAGSGGLVSASADLTLGSGGVATVMYSTSTVIEITGGGIT